MDGMDNIVTRSVLDTVSTMLHVTRVQVCVTEVVMTDGVGIHVMKVGYNRVYKTYREVTEALKFSRRTKKTKQTISVLSIL